MKTQQDTRLRMVALDNLIAMCARVSSHCHTYTVTNVSRSRVHVEYSNPSEYGTPDPVTAVLPCYPSVWRDDADNPRVVLDPIRYINDRDEAWQAFDILWSCPTLWRRHADDPDWRSHAEIRAAGDDKPGDQVADTCVVCDLPARVVRPSGHVLLEPD